jgi:DNA-binding protein HU-beta
MNKGELVTAIAAKLDDATKKDIDAILSAAIECIQESVSEGDKVTLVGFGTFERRERSERSGRNPQTGASMTIAASQVPRFTAGKVFKEKVAA